MILVLLARGRARLDSFQVSFARGRARLDRACVAGVCVGLLACSNHGSSDKLERELAAASAADAGADPSSVVAQAIYEDVASGTINPAALEFTPDYPLWSDGADKRRWVLLPEDAQIDTSDMDHWKFPVGTKFVKEFSLDGVRLETRVIERIADTGNLKKDLVMSVFVWSEDQSEAILTKDGAKDLFGTPHDVPRQKDCIACHVGEESGTLGFSAIQLSESGMLRKLERRGLLSDPPGRLFKLPGTDVEREAIGRLHANCAHCHTEGTPADVMRLRVLVREVDLPFSEWELYRTTVGQEVVKWSPRPEGFDTRIVPGVPEASALLFRMQQRDSDTSEGEQMPPLASELVDTEAVAAVRAWIAAMEPSETASEPDAGASDVSEQPAVGATHETPVAPSEPGAMSMDAGVTEPAAEEPAAEAPPAS
jgi:hypothetical protein